MKYRIVIFFLAALSIFQDNVWAQDFQKDFELFSIRIDKKGTGFIPTYSDLKKFVGKEEIRIKQKMLFTEYDGWRDYGINIDGTIGFEDSILLKYGLNYNVKNTTVIEIIDDRLIVSIPAVYIHKNRFIRNDKGEVIKDSTGEWKTEYYERFEVAFFLYDLKMEKVIIDDTLKWMNMVTKGGFLVEKGWDSIHCDECRYNMIDFNGNYLFEWVTLRQLLADDKYLKKVHPDAKSFYNKIRHMKSDTNSYCYMDKDNKSHYIKVDEEHWYPTVDFYFSAFYTSYIKDDTIFLAAGEAKLQKYVVYAGGGAFGYYSDSIGTDKAKDFIPFDTAKLSMMIFSDFYIHTQTSEFEVGTISSKIRDEDWPYRYPDSLDASGNKAQDIVRQFPGRLLVYNRVKNELIHDLYDQRLIDFNYNYYLALKRKVYFKKGKPRFNNEYVIYDKDFKEMKRTKDKNDFYKLK